jgi:hypothetical protein
LTVRDATLTDEADLIVGGAGGVLGHKNLGDIIGLIISWCADSNSNTWNADLCNVSLAFFALREQPWDTEAATDVRLDIGELILDVLLIGSDRRSEREELDEETEVGAVD